ncbi:MAG TPA: TonB-dependent siderophore receptor [Rhodanobacteraceae bacterium]|nr:TonB-dependent siderophore receptor [Rhodanobacteraceae bacterium]
MPSVPTSLGLALLAGLAVSAPPAHAATIAAAAAESTPDSATPPPRKVTQLAPVEVKAKKARDTRASELASYGNASLHDTPAAVTVVDRRQLDDSQIHSLIGLAAQDPSLGDGYAPIGYIQNLTIRGYPLDLATGYRINNLPVTGEQYIPFEDKREVQILQGLAGIQAGVMEPGGVVNYVSKPPADVRTLTLGTDSHGSRYTALDVGGWLTPNFGLRANVAWEEMHAYVDHAHGHRRLYSIAADWRLAPGTTLQLNSDYQVYAQRSVSAYQLLGGGVIPRVTYRSQMLAWEPWQQPTTARASNTSAHLRSALGAGWQFEFAAGHSRSVVDDNAAFAYGCTGAPGCVDGPTPSAWFAPNGDYDVWDFRSPGETYVDDEARATLTGTVDTGVIRQDLTFGAQAFHHTVALPNEVFDFAGIANIDQRTPPFFPPSPDMPGPVIPRLDSWQRSAFALDRIHLGAHWQLVGGAHFVRLAEQAWNSDGTPARTTRLAKALPQAALLWQPTTALTTYLSYAKGLSLGVQAPYWTTNAGDTLAPRLSRQIEAGAKYQWSPMLDLEAAVYRIHQPYPFAAPDAADSGFTFIQRGQEVHTGLELSAHGDLTANLHADAGIAWIRALAQDTGVPAYEGHQVANVPRARATFSLAYRLPTVPKLAVLGGWQYAAPNAATADGSVRVPAFNVFNAGLRYTSTWNGRRVVWRLMVDNVFDRFYWRYTGSDGNDSYLLPGAPRLARLTVEVAL